MVETDCLGIKCRNIIDYRGKCKTRVKILETKQITRYCSVDFTCCFWCTSCCQHINPSKEVPSRGERDLRLQRVIRCAHAQRGSSDFRVTGLMIVCQRELT